MNLIQDKLDVKNKTRANLFNWRGQFTPEFVDYILECIDSEIICKFVPEIQDFINAVWYNPSEALKRGSFVVIK